MAAMTTFINRKKGSTVKGISSTKLGNLHADVALKKPDKWCISGAKAIDSFKPHQNLKRSGAQRELE